MASSTALRRAGTLVTLASLALGCAVAVRTPATASPAGALQIGVATDQVTTASGQLVLAGSAGVDIGAPGAERTRVSGVPSARALALASDGTVYASGTEGLFAIDPATATATPVSTGDRSCLGDVAATGSATVTVWVISTCDADGATAPALVPVTGGVVGTSDIALSGTRQLQLASAPGRPDLLAVVDTGTYSYTDADGVDITYQAPRLRLIDSRSTGAPLHELRLAVDGAPVVALDSSGTRLLAGAGQSVGLWRLDATTDDGLAVLGSVDVSSVAAAAFTADGRYVAVANSGFGPAVTVVRTSDARAVRTVPLSTTGGQYTVGWSGASLATTTHAASGDSLVVTPDAYRATLVLDLLQQYSTTLWNDPVMVEGSLRTATGTEVEGVTLAVTRSGPGGTQSLRSVKTGAYGRFVLVDRPAGAGNYVYTVTRTATDAQYSSVSAKVTWVVERRYNFLTIRTDRDQYRVGQRVVITARLSHWSTNRVVRIYGKGYRKAQVLLGTGSVDKSGVYRKVVYLPYSAIFTATYGGDAHYAAASGSTYKITANAVVTLSLSKPLSRKGSTSYYRQGKRAFIGAYVAPFVRGRFVDFVVQQRVRSKWRYWGSGSARTAKDGWAVVALTGKKGNRFRVYASAEEDDLSGRGSSAWRYLSFR